MRQGSAIGFVCLSSVCCLSSENILESRDLQGKIIAKVYNNHGKFLKSTFTIIHDRDRSGSIISAFPALTNFISFSFIFYKVIYSDTMEAGQTPPLMPEYTITVSLSFLPFHSRLIFSLLPYNHSFPLLCFSLFCIDFFVPVS